MPSPGMGMCEWGPVSYADTKLVRYDLWYWAHLLQPLAAKMQLTIRAWRMGASRNITVNVRLR